MATLTTAYSFSKPTVSADRGIWGTLLNENFEKIDELLSGIIAIDGAVFVNGDFDGTHRGNGSNLLALNATQLTTGTIPVARIADLAQSKVTNLVADLAALTTNANSRLLATANAVSATKLNTARNITLGGDVTGFASFDGTAGVTITATVVDNSHNHTSSDGNFTVGSNLVVTGTATLDIINARGGQQIVLNAGESDLSAPALGGEKVYINAENGLEINVSPDNWGSGWAGRLTAQLLYNSSGASIFPGTVTAPSFDGGGANLTNLNGSAIGFGTVPEARIHGDLVRFTRRVDAGDGLTGGGNLSNDKTITLGNPSSITATSTNSVTGSSHTHSLSNSTVRSLYSESTVGFNGTYAMLRHDTASNREPGYTTSGGNLVYASGGGTDFSSTSPAGTWMLSGYIKANAAERSSLWLRVA